MDKITQLEIFAGALLAGLVDLHGGARGVRLARLAEGLAAGQPLEADADAIARRRLVQRLEDRRGGGGKRLPH